MIVGEHSLDLIHNYYLGVGEANKAEIFHQFSNWGELTWLTYCPGIPSPNAKQEQECLLGMGKMYTDVLLGIVPCLDRTKWMWNCTLHPLWHLCKRQRYLSEQFERMEQTLVGFKNLRSFYRVQCSGQSNWFCPTVSHVYLILGKYFIRWK